MGEKDRTRAIGGVVWEGQDDRRNAKEILRSRRVKGSGLSRQARLLRVSFKRAERQIEKLPGGVILVAFVRMGKKVNSPLQRQATPVHPTAHAGKGWPLAAIRDWEHWGFKNMTHFFNVWPELKPEGFSPAEDKPS